MIKTLEIIWEHTPDMEEVPVITSNTKKTFCILIKELRPAFEKEDIVLKFISRPITDPDRMQSRLTLNGRSLWDIIMEVAGEQRLCEGRRCEMNTPVRYPLVVVRDIQYQSVPDLVLRKVFLRACGLI
jgi:hypothetical protein